TPMKITPADLPKYPAVGFGVSGQLDNAARRITATAQQLDAALDQTVEQFGRAFAAEDRHAATRSRIRATVDSNKRRNF
ncbi:hypothetical protein, partial [Microbacterium paludicola]|uniref:hypothetical protein n=1 Tax=Microbacterium paludicola TaxID=300019 RepID=UPI0031E30B4D